MSGSYRGVFWRHGPVDLVSAIYGFHYVGKVREQRKSFRVRTSTSAGDFPPSCRGVSVSSCVQRGKPWLCWSFGQNMDEDI